MCGHLDRQPRRTAPEPDLQAAGPSCYVFGHLRATQPRWGELTPTKLGPCCRPGFRLPSHRAQGREVLPGKISLPIKT